MCEEQAGERGRVNPWTLFRDKLGQEFKRDTNLSKNDPLTYVIHPLMLLFNLLLTFVTSSLPLISFIHIFLFACQQKQIDSHTLNTQPRLREQSVAFHSQWMCDLF